MQLPSPGVFAATRGSRRLALRSICLLIALAAAGDATAQQDWAQFYSGGINTEQVYAVTATEDGGFVAAGFTSSFHGGWVFKLDEGGNLLWEKRFGHAGFSGEHFRSIDRTVDGGFIVAGRAPGGLWVVRLDCDGNPVWEKEYSPLSNSGTARSVKQTSDGGYVVTGEFLPPSGANRQVWVLKLDASGNIQWQKIFGDAGDDFGVSAVEVSGGVGGYAVLASTRSFGAGNADFLLLRLNLAGGILWTKTYGGSGNDGNNPLNHQGASIQQTSAGGFVLAGWTDSFGSGGGDAWLLELDGSGNVQGEWAYGGASNDGAYQALEIPSGGYIIAGHVDTLGSWGLRLDAAGNIVWQKDYDGSRAYGVALTHDGGFLFVGNDNAVPERSFAFKTDADGEIDPSCTFIQNTTYAMTSPSAVVGTPVVPSSNTTVTAATAPATVTNTTASVVTQCTGSGIFPLSVNLCAGTNWLALPTCSPLTRAEDLCADIGSAAVSVTQQFPFVATWTYDCLAGSCTPATPEPGTCGSSCFCIDDGEGFEVTLNNSVVYVVQGTEAEVPITLPPGGAEYLFSVPYDTFLVNANDLLAYVGPAQTVQRLDCASQLTESWDGTSGVNFTLIPGETYRISYGSPVVASFTNPTNHRGPCPLPPCPTITQGGGYCITGHSTGQVYSWWIDLNLDGLISGSEPFENSAPPVLPVGSSASRLARRFAKGINKQAFSSGVFAAVVGNCFTLAARSGTPELYVGPQDFPQTCMVTTGGCSYNPIIRKVASLDCVSGECGDTDDCTVDFCDPPSGLCLNIPEDDADLDLICDALDNCPVDANSDQEDVDADVVGDVCDNCVQISNPLQGPAVLGQEIVAENLGTFHWSSAVDVLYARGALATVDSYLTDQVQSLPLADSFTDAMSPLPGDGLFYLVRPDCPVGSWQNGAGAEPQRDLILP